MLYGVTYGVTYGVVIAPAMADLHCYATNYAPVYVHMYTYAGAMHNATCTCQLGSSEHANDGVECRCMYSYIV